MSSLLPSSSLSEFPHRVLVTNIPLHISSEEFYDILRSYTGGTGVHNALLIEIPLENTHLTMSATLIQANESNCMNASKNSNSKRNCKVEHDHIFYPYDNNGNEENNYHRNYHHKQGNQVTHLMNKRPREEHNTVGFEKRETSELDKFATRSTGAALVDFVSKAFAEIVMQTGIVIEGNEVHWENVGLVIPSAGSLAAAQCYDAEKMRLIGREVYNQSSLLLYNINKSEREHATRKQEHNSAIKDENFDDFCENRMESVNKKCSRDEEIVRLVYQGRCFENANNIYYTTEKSEKEQNTIQVKWKSITDIHAEYQQQQQQQLELYTSFDNAVRRITGRHIYSLEVLHESEIHIIVNTQTAQLLREEKFVDVEMRESLFSVFTESNGTTNKDKTVLRWKVMETPHRRVDTVLLLASKTLTLQKNKSESENDKYNGLRWDEVRSNIKLCAKIEVMNAMAQFMSWSKGKVGALKDKYGNVLLPYSSLKTI